MEMPLRPPQELCLPNYWRDNSDKSPVDLLFVHLPTAVRDLRLVGESRAAKEVARNELVQFAKRIPGFKELYSARIRQKLRSVKSLVYGILLTGGTLHPASKKLVLANEHEKALMRADRKHRFGHTFRNQSVEELCTLLRPFLHDPTVLDRVPADGVFHTPGGAGKAAFTADVKAIRPFRRGRR